MPSSNICWGIDIGAGGVKGIKLEKEGSGGVRLADFIVIPHKKVLSTPGLDESDALRISLGALMSQYREALKGATICVSVPGHSAFARFAKLPPVDPKGVPNLVKFEAVQQIPFPIEEVEWDYQTFSNPDSPDLEVGIFAITKERVNEKLSLWGDIGLNPDQLTLGPVAAYNGIAFDLSFTDKTPGTIILDIGTVATDLIIAEGGRVWMRTFPLGGHNFTEAINETFQLNNYTKADKLKAEGEASKFKQHIFTGIKPVLSDLVQDVQRSISYYQETHPDSNLTRLVGLGSTFKILGLRKLLSQQLKMDVVRMERFNRISLDGPAAADFEAATPTLATAYGLALQGLGLTPITANLMPVSVIRDAMWRRKLPWFLTAAGIGIAAGGVSFLRPFMESSKVTRLSEDSTVQTVVRMGESLKKKWVDESGAAQPKFLAENVRRLLEGREIYAMFLRDVESMTSAANKLADKRPDSVRIAGESFDLLRLDTDYLAPGTPLKAGGADASGAAGGGGAGGHEDRGGPSDGGSGAPAGGGEAPAGAADANAAGPIGAFKITMVVQSQDTGGLPFLNDSILHWLKANAERPGLPYVIVNPPKVEDVQTRVIPPSKAGDAGAAPPGGGGGGGGAPGTLPPKPGGAPQGDGREDRGGGGAGGGMPNPRGGQPQSIDAMAPLEPPKPRLDPTKPTNEYTISWTVQMRQPVVAAEPGKEADKPAEGQEKKS